MACSWHVDIPEQQPMFVMIILDLAGVAGAVVNA